MILGKKGLDLLEEIIPIGVKGQERIVEVSLKDTVGAIHRAVGQGIDHMISATDMMGGSRTGFQTSPVKTGDEKVFLSCSDGVLLGEDRFNQSFSYPVTLSTGIWGRLFKTACATQSFSAFSSR